MRFEIRLSEVFSAYELKKKKINQQCPSEKKKKNVNVYRLKIYWVISILKVIIRILISTIIISSNPSLSVFSSSVLIGFYLCFQYQY